MELTSVRTKGRGSSVITTIKLRDGSHVFDPPQGQIVCAVPFGAALRPTQGTVGWKSGWSVRLFSFGIRESVSPQSVSLLTWRSVHSDDKLAFRMYG